MKKLSEMSKAEMQQEIAVAQDVVNNGGSLTEKQWTRVAKMLILVKED